MLRIIWLTLLRNQILHSNITPACQHPISVTQRDREIFLFLHFENKHADFHDEAISSPIAKRCCARSSIARAFVSTTLVARLSWRQRKRGWTCWWSISV